MNSLPGAIGQHDQLPERCWNCIGILGDRSCPRLVQVAHCHNCPVFAAAGQQLLERQPPPHYAQGWARQIAPPSEVATTDMLPVLIFRIAAEWLAMDVRSAVEVVSPRPVHGVPQRTGRLLQGLVNVRGELQLCMSLQQLLEIQPSPCHDRDAPTGLSRSMGRLLVAQRDSTRWVFPVDEIDGVHYLPRTALQELPATLLKGLKSFSQAVFSHGGRQVGLLSETQVFDALERAAL